MPALLAPLIVAGAGALGIGVTLATASIIASGIIFASTLVYGAVQQKRMAEKARRQANQNLQDRTVSVISSDAPWAVIYGEATVGAVISDMLTSGDKDQFKHVIMIWAAHECHSIEDILVKGESIGALDASGNVTGGKWYKGDTRNSSVQVTFNGAGTATLPAAPSSVQSVVKQTLLDYGEGDRVLRTDQVYDISGLVIADKTITKASLAGLTLTVTYTWQANGTPLLRVHHHLGNSAQGANPTLLAELPGVWSADDRLRGLCYSVIRYDLSEPEFQGGPLQVTARIKGRKCWDPRSSTRAWTDNPALCTADFLQAEWGKAALDAQLVWASVAAAANACDELLPTPAGQKRYTCNGSFKTDQETDGTLTQLCQAMAGFAVYSGAWSLQAGVYTAPVMALSDADNAGAVEVIAAAPGNELFNGLRGRFYDPARFDQATDYSPYSNAAFIGEDGGALWGELNLPFTNANWRCANMARVFVERSRGMQLVYPAKNRARALRAGQRITLSNSVLGMTNAVFRVVKREHRAGQPVVLTLAQDDATMYDLADAPASLASPSVPVSNPFLVEPVAGLAVASSESVAQWDANGNVLGNSYASWSASTDVLVQQHGAMQIEYRLADDPAWTRMPEQPGSSTGVLLPLLAEQRAYVVAARWRNGIGTTGDWRYASVLTTTLPPKPMVYTQPSEPIGRIADGAIWIDTDDKNRLYVRTAGVWVSRRDQLIDDAFAAAANAQDTADGKIDSFYQPAQPASGMALGDLWFDTDDSNKLYRYNGSAWVAAQDARIGSALNNAATAQATADGKVTTFFTTATPTALALGDLWYSSSTALLKRWDGGAWVTVSNSFANTNQLVDGAGLGSTSTWAGVSGAGKPADNATNGATWGGNIGGQPGDASLLNSYVPTGINLIYNSAFEAGLVGWSPSGMGGINVTTNVNNSWRLLPIDAPWTSVLCLEQVGGSTDQSGNTYLDLSSAAIPVQAGRRYVLSAYMQMHRCTGALFMRVYNAAGAYIVDGAAWAQIGDNSQPDGQSLDRYARLSGGYVMPAEAVRVDVVLRKMPTFPGNGSSYLFGTRLQFEEAAADAGPSAWSDGARQHTITAGNAPTYVGGGAIGTPQLGSGAVTQVVTATTAEVVTPGTSTTALSTTQTLGAITTSANGDGKVLILLNGKPESQGYSYVGHAWMAGAAGWNYLYCRIWRNGTLIHERVFPFTNNYTRELFDSTSMLVDTPGAGVTATYTYEVYTWSQSTATHSARICAAQVAIMEIRK